ncbi:MAG: hypothetical protein HYS60_02530, partial [Candidatus Wildermuthbacteria bacterium]|nr:hypothetical protein [Candidatus Wildermuthbacteria bacterium]
MELSLLRRKYPRFIYKGYSFALSKGNLAISFDFAVPASPADGPPDISFHPRVLIKNVPQKDIKRVGEKTLRNLVFHLGLMEIPSYWKATCSPEIIVEAGYLNARQISWWKDLIMQGMGEYFYKNKIDFTKSNFLSIISLAKSRSGKLNLVKESLTKLSLREKVLVPVGGGKDAAVTLELLKQAKIPLHPFMLNPKKEQLAIARISKTGDSLVVERSMDPKLFELNRKGYLNGHTPFSAYLAFLAVLEAVLFDYKYVALSNERSSNEGNVKYLGKIVNHQYSKSFEFEKKFREYSRLYLSKDVEYFSFLRPLYELQIAKLFSRYPQYFHAFLSCNEANKTKSGKKKPTGKWCGKCAKCLFVFLALSPFAGEKATINIFKKDLLRDKTLKPLLGDLTGKRKFKPFVSVGTIKESK